MDADNAEKHSEKYAGEAIGAGVGGDAAGVRQSYGGDVEDMAAAAAAFDAAFAAAPVGAPKTGGGKIDKSKGKAGKTSGKPKGLQAVGTYGEAVKCADDLMALLGRLVGWLNGDEGSEQGGGVGPNLHEGGSGDGGSPRGGDWSTLPPPCGGGVTLRPLVTNRGGGGHDDGGCWTGDGSSAVALVVGVLGLADAAAVAGKIEGLRKLRKALVDAGVESDAVRSVTVNDLEALLWRLSYVLQSNGGDYQLLLRTVTAAGGGASSSASLGKPQRRRRSWGGDALGSLRGVAHGGGDNGHSSEPPSVLSLSLDLVCLRAAHPFAFATAAARSVLLASGTLGPLQLLAHELGVQAPSAAGNASSSCGTHMAAPASSLVAVNSSRHATGAAPTSAQATAQAQAQAFAAVASKALYTPGLSASLRRCVGSSAAHHTHVDAMVLRAVVPAFNRTPLRLTQR